MHIFAFSALLIALALCLGLGFWIVLSLWSGKEVSQTILRNGQSAVFGLVTLSSLVLCWALVSRDFSFVYVIDYTNRVLPLFYTLTAFWAGQSGSLLFWMLMISLFGFIWMFTSKYKQLSPMVSTYYWLFFFGVQALFLLLLTGPTNPFLKLVPAAPDGNGLNPLLQHPGMIFHPPVLFMGYAGFTIPFCLAAAYTFAGEKPAWLSVGRNWAILSWIYLTVGIILGGWWSYMELGWGGYWAWDPVENASMLPWFVSSAYLHTAIIGRKKKALTRINLLLIGLTLALCFFATYLVRSGIVNSLHAFGGEGIGVPLLTLIGVTLGVTVLAMFKVNRSSLSSVGDPFSRQGIMILLALLLCLLGLIVFLGTMWPVISRLWSASPIGLEITFYNTTCLPLFTLIGLFFMLCPWLSWKKGLTKPKGLYAVLVIWVVAAILLWNFGMDRLHPLIAASSAMAGLASIGLLFYFESGLRKKGMYWGIYGVHAGLVLMIFGVAWSGPFKVEKEFILEPEQTIEFEAYTITYQGVEEKSEPGISILEARLDVLKHGKAYGTLTPQRRIYSNFDRPFAEVSVIPSFGSELYSTLLAATPEGIGSFKISVNPLINWIWIGGTLMCVAGFFCLSNRKKNSGQEQQE